MARFFISFIFLIIGFAVMKYAVNLEDWTGRMEWGERYFGGTINFIKIIGLLFVIGSLLYLFGILPAILGAVGRIFGG